MNVSPTSAEANKTDCRVVHSQNLAEFNIRQITLLDHPNTLFGESSIAGALAPDVSPTTNHLANVVRVRPQVEMRRVDANRSVAGVKNMQPIHRAIKNLVRDDVRTPGFAVNSDLPISILVSSGRPVPASLVGGITRHKPCKYFSFGFKVRRSSWVSNHRGHNTGLPR